jgi:DNA-binding transcriptional LysR family regulator
LGDVTNHRCIVGHRRGRPLSWHVSGEGEATRFMPPSTYQVGDADAMVDAALAGSGLCQMPLVLFRSHIEAGRLKTVLDDFTQHEVDVHAVWPRAVHLLECSPKREVKMEPGLAALIAIVGVGLIAAFLYAAYNLLFDKDVE